MAKDEWVNQWLIDWSEWIDRKIVDRGYPSSTAEWRVANGCGRSGPASTVVPNIEASREVTIVNGVVSNADCLAKKAVYWAYQYQEAMPMTEHKRKQLFMEETNRSARTYHRKIALVKLEIKRRA